MWLAYATVCAVVLLAYSLGDYSRRRAAPRWAEVLHYLRIFWVEGLSPMLFGVRVPAVVMAPPSLHVPARRDWHGIFIVAAQVALIGLVAWSVARRRAAWRAWAFLLVAVGGQRADGGRTGLELGAEAVGYYISYYTEPTLLVALAIPFAFAAPRLRARVAAVERPPPRRRRRAGRVVAGPPQRIGPPAADGARRRRGARGAGGIPGGDVGDRGQLLRPRGGDDALAEKNPRSRGGTRARTSTTCARTSRPPAAPACSPRCSTTTFPRPCCRSSPTSTPRPHEEGALHPPELRAAPLRRAGELQPARTACTSCGPTATSSAPASCRPPGVAGGAAARRAAAVTEARVEHQRGEWCVVAEGLGAPGVGAAPAPARARLVAARPLPHRSRAAPLAADQRRDGWMDEGPKLPPMGSRGTAFVALSEPPTGAPTNAGVRLGVPPFGRLCLRSLEIGSFDPSPPPP